MDCSSKTATAAAWLLSQEERIDPNENESVVFERANGQLDIILPVYYSEYADPPTFGLLSCSRAELARLIAQWECFDQVHAMWQSAWKLQWYQDGAITLYGTEPWTYFMARLFSSWWEGELAGPRYHVLTADTRGLYWRITPKHGDEWWETEVLSIDELRGIQKATIPPSGLFLADLRVQSEHVPAGDAGATGSGSSPALHSK